MSASTAETKMWLFYLREKYYPQENKEFTKTLEERYPHFKTKWEKIESNLAEYRKKGVIL